MKQIELLKRKLRSGAVYHRAELSKLSTAVDRHLQELVKTGVIEKLAGGLYYVPKQSAFGKVPAGDNELVKAFLKDSRFVVTSANDYNALGVGTTQLYNTRRVYNFKRHGNFKLGNRSFHFVRKPYVPEKVTKEFLLVDLVNNLKHLAEDESAVINKVKEKVEIMNKSKLKYFSEHFGTVGTRKFFDSLLHT
ncbi:MAG TPA: DUF6088 family protein [Hanamia sp.]|nr:DUF6088 family protein [Hanamia sp.]